VVDEGVVARFAGRRETIAAYGHRAGLISERVTKLDGPTAPEAMLRAAYERTPSTTTERVT
jgi:hypothetical protein